MPKAPNAKPVINRQPSVRFMLGHISVSPSHNTLSANGRTVRLQPKAMAVLEYLAIHQSRVVSAEELMDELWAGRVVTHGSVQKSITALRSGLTELAGNQEFIVHYSKRGYQLVIEPIFEAPTDTGGGSPENQLETVAEVGAAWRKPLLLAASFITVALFITNIQWQLIYLPTNHSTVFNLAKEYTLESGHERNPAPHPDNQHLAYIRDNDSNLGLENSSEIIVRNESGKDWKIAGTEGNWYKLAWSPDGINLVAIEIKSRNPPQFYESPNHLYSFHIFSLDLENQRLLEKQQLSDWHGRIYSVTWWDDQTLEIVAKQGPTSGNGRYHYSLLKQQLRLLDEYEGAGNPLASAVLNRKTALASLSNNKIRIDFLDHEQQLINRVQLDVAEADINWIPDGSGVLVYAENEQRLFTINLRGEQTDIVLAPSKYKSVRNPLYRPDGHAIYYTHEKRQSKILLHAKGNARSSIIPDTEVNHAATFSPDGKKIVYASVRNNQTHLWMLTSGIERQITSDPLPAKVDAFAWSADGSHIIFNSASKLYYHNLSNGQTTLFLNAADSDRIEPIAFFPKENRAFALKYKNGAANLWQIDNSIEKQLTFGSIGSAIAYEGNVLFQYLGENGLWIRRNESDSLEQLTPNLDRFSKLLKADKDGFYFVTGGVCNESSVFYQRYLTAERTIVLEQVNKKVFSTSFDPTFGLLQTDCRLTEANIMMMH